MAPTVNGSEKSELSMLGYLRSYKNWHHNQPRNVLKGPRLYYIKSTEAALESQGY